MIKEILNLLRISVYKSSERKVKHDEIKVFAFLRHTNELSFAVTVSIRKF